MMKDFLGIVCVLWNGVAHKWQKFLFRETFARQFCGEQKFLSHQPRIQKKRKMENYM